MLDSVLLEGEDKSRDVNMSHYLELPEHSTSTTLTVTGVKFRSTDL